MNAVRIDLKTWPQLLPFRQPMPARSPSRDFVVPVFVSVVIHAFLAFLLGVVVTNRTAFEPTAPSIDTHLIVSLTTFDTASHNELDREAVSVVPHTDSPDQRSQPSPERSLSAERRAEAESIVASKGQELPSSEAPDGKSLATDEIPSIDLEADYRIDWEFGRTSEPEFETFVTSLGLEIPGLETLDGKSLASDEIPSIDLEADYRIDWEFGRTSEPEFKTFVTSLGLEIPDLNALDGKSFATDEIPSMDLDSIFRHIVREGTWMSESEVQRQRYELGMLYKKKYMASLPPDCRTVYAGMGLLAIPFLVRDAVIGNGCKWYRKIH